ncbi:RsiV family protein [Rhodococcus sp. NPDC056960]|uniref:RsiV family protein n=1 Tax=Rhodococcus sp. NPDC056960 TaxID=3345982 RepID=UPI00362C7E83
MSGMRRSVLVSLLGVAALLAPAACSDRSGTAVSEQSAPATVSAADTTGTDATTSASRPYTETEEQVTGSTGRVRYDVTIPQIEGGDPAVTAEFNESMHAALQDQIDGSGTDSFTLSSEDHSVAHIGEHVISGLLVTSWNADPPGAHPTPIVATVVVNADTAAPITLGDLFPDLPAGLQKLSDESARLLPETIAGPDFERSGIEPTEANFANWLATPNGMEIHFNDYQVGPHAIGLVTITVPWDALADVIDPDLAPVVSS